MSCTNDPIFEDDIGTVFEFTITECINGVDTVVDVSSQSSMSFFFKKPDKSLLTKTPSFTTDGTDGKIEYTTLTGDLDAPGDWFLQAEVVIPASGTFRTSLIAFTVFPKLVAG